MKKLIPFIALLTFGYSASAQLLWKVSGKGVEKPSFILGTHHFCAGNFCDSIPGFYEAYATVEQVTCEMNMLEMASLSGEDLAKLHSYMILPEGVTFSSLFEEKELQIIDTFLKNHLGVGVDFAADFKPVSLMVQIQNYFLRKMMPEILTQSGIDTFVQELAIKDGKTISGLETPEFQMSVLYGKSLEEQAEELIEFITQEDILYEATSLTEAYKNKDLKALERFMRKGLDKESYQNLVKNRNIHWVKTMEESIPTTPTLYAVGAGHLPGKYGVINLLKKAGYTVEPVVTK